MPTNSSSELVKSAPRRPHCRRAAFSGHDGQLRFSGGVLRGDTNGDRVADIEIRIVGALLAGDVIL